MGRWRHTRWWLVLVLFTLSAPAFAQAIRIAAIVNDDVITSQDVDERRNLVIVSSNMPNTVETQQRLNPRVLETLITERLEMQEGKRLSIEISDAEIAGAYPKIDVARNQQEGTLKRFLAEHPEFKRTVEDQVRAQLTWSRVVERKIKRSVNIAQDEIARAQAAEASAPGQPEVHIAAISIPIASKKDEKKAAKLAGKLSEQLNQGADFITLAQEVAGTHQADLSPPTWVAENALQPAMQQALRSLKPGQVTQPLRSQNSYQLISLIDRRMSKPQADSTEVVVKQISVPLPEKKTKDALQAARDTTRELRGSPGGCDEAQKETFNGKAMASFARVKYTQMSPELRNVIEHLHVGEVSDPLLTESDIKLVMLCERIEPPATLPDAAKVKQRIYEEKVDLEAEKYLRNLRRDAYIDIKGGGA